MGSRLMGRLPLPAHIFFFFKGVNSAFIELTSLGLIPAGPPTVLRIELILGFFFGRCEGIFHVLVPKMIWILLSKMVIWIVLRYYFFFSGKIGPLFKYSLFFRERDSIFSVNWE